MLVWRTFHRTDLWAVDLGEFVGDCSWALCMTIVQMLLTLMHQISTNEGKHFLNLKISFTTHATYSWVGGLLKNAKSFPPPHPI